DGAAGVSQQRAQRQAFVVFSDAPPAGECLSVVGARHRRGSSRVRTGIDEGLPGCMPIALPTEDLAAGNLEARERGADEAGNHAEILGDDRRAGVAEQLENRFALPGLRGLLKRVEERLARRRLAVRAVQADEMIDPVAVIERGHPARALADPGEAALSDAVPAIRRQAPVLARRTECVRRNTERNLEHELIGP